MSVGQIVLDQKTCSEKQFYNNIGTRTALRESTSAVMDVSLFVVLRSKLSPICQKTRLTFLTLNQVNLSHLEPG
jgi:hypothetical protein